MAKIDVKKLTPEIKKKYKAYNNALKLDLIKNPEKDRKGEPKDEINVIVGDDKQPDKFYPQVKICRWSNEVNLSFRLKEDDKEEPIIDFDRHKVLYKKNKKECHFYEIEPNELLREGGYEFEVILKEKPSTNKIEFTINTKGLRFYYQPPMTEEKLEEGQTADETHIYDKDGNVVAERPENVVGSYAVYHESKGGAVEKNDKDYKVGKVGHIYRPKIIDANGNETWGKLSIDKKNGILSVEIPQEFLDSAVYPVKVDPTFGYDTAGGSAHTFGDGSGEGKIVGSKFTLSEDGNVTEITASVCLYGAQDVPYKLGIYTEWPLEIGSSENSVPAWTSGQNWQSASVSGSLTAGDYWLVAFPDYSKADMDTPSFYYDSGNTNQGVYTIWGEVSYPTWPDPLFSGEFNTPNYLDKKLSIYCTYTAGGTTYTKTATAKARILQNYTKTIQARARLKATLDKTVSAKARILTSGIAKTVTAKARVRQTGISKTVTAKARIKQAGVAKTVQAKARILQTPTKTIQTRARIKIADISKTISTKARILQVVSKTIQARARIKSTYTKTTTAKARIVSPSISKTIQARARVRKIGITKTISTRADIKKLGIAKTIQARAKIVRILAKTITAKARIFRTYSKVIQARARIGQSGVIKTIQAKARVKQVGISKVITAQARVKKTEISKIIQAKARVKRTFTKTIQARANLLYTYLKTIQAQARIKQTGLTKTIQARAKILQVVSKTITARGRIKQEIHKTIKGRARVKKVGITKTAQARARVKRVGITKNIEAQARILKTFIKTLTAKAKITYWFGEGLKYATADAYPRLGKSVPYPSARSASYQLAKSIY